MLPRLLRRLRRLDDLLIRAHLPTRRPLHCTAAKSDISEIAFRHRPPSLSPQTVVALLRKHFPFQEVHKKSIKALPSYDDRNFYFCGVLDLDPNQSSQPDHCNDPNQSSQPDHCNDPNQSSQPDHCNVQQFVFKVYSTATSYGVLDGQNCIMKHLISKGVNCPYPILSRGGKEIEVLSASQLNGVGSAEIVDCNFCACVLTFIPGEVMMDRVSVTPQLLYDLGNYIGKVDAALQDLHHADIESREDVEWDLKHFLQLKSHLRLLKTPKEREMVAKVFEEFEEYVLPKIPSMAHGVIYGDANSLNIIIQNRNGEPNLGIIDFGGSVHTCYVFGLAIMLAYAMLEKENPLQISCPVLCGYLNAFALSDEELDCLYYLVLARLCQSVLNSAYHLKHDPHNAYLLLVPPRAWRLMEHLRSVPKAEVDRMWAKAREEWSASHT